MNLPQRLPEKTNQVAVALHSGKGMAIDIRRQMIDLPEVGKALTPVERHIFVASTKKQICEIPDKDLVEKTKSMFRFIAMDVGYNIPDIQDWQYICTRLLTILKLYFDKITLSDVKLAFELATVGELDAFLPKDSQGNPDRKHYQNFNPEFFSKILRAYQARQGGVITKAIKALPEPENVVSDDQKKYYSNVLLRDLIIAFLQYKYLLIKPNLTPVTEMLFYERLEKSGLAIGVSISEEEKQRAFSRLMINSRKINEFEARKIRTQGIKNERVLSDAYVIARRKALIETFDYIIEEGIYIYKHLKFDI